MCGIVGIAGNQEEHWIAKMNDVQFHRGPDDAGVYFNEGKSIALAMRRLSILDLSGGHQPMSNDDESIWIVFNGEIFNAPDIRKRLEKKDIKFFTDNSDTEVIIRLYEEKGMDLLKELNGMFAFVIYDKKRNILEGARDRMGIKPFYFTQLGNRFAFSSELKSILTLPYIDREIDFQSLYHYMSLLYVPDQSSIIKGIERLPPGHKFIYDIGRKNLKITKYWQPTFKEDKTKSVDEWSEKIREGLGDAVNRWTLSDVPIACSLSGGIDSSAIVGLIAERGMSNIKTYSLGFVGEGEEAFSELKLAKEVASRWGTDHHELLLEPDELLNDLIKMVWHLDEPYAGGLPSWYVYKTMGEDVKVGMTGTGGDELFGNYGKWRKFENEQRLKLGLSMRNTSKLGTDMLGKFFPYKEKALKEPFGQNYYALSSYFSDQQKNESVFEIKYNDFQHTSTYLQQMYDSNGIKNIRNGIAAIDFRNQLAEEFLSMTDRFSMAHGLEARTPFLDHEFVEMALNIPPSIRTKNTDLKYLLKKSVIDLLPKELLNVPKQGFVIPIELWIRGKLGSLIKKLLDPDRLKLQGIFKPEFYYTYVLPHMEGKKNYTRKIWAALMFQLWHIIYIENNQIDEPSYNWKDIIT